MECSRQQKTKLGSWFTSQALPFWATKGFDTERQRFAERLTLHGEKIEAVPTRVMVQARQVYVYALAAQNGWFPLGGRLATAAFDSMVRNFYRRDGRPGWIFSIDGSGEIADPCRDLYAHAFVLLAISSYVNLIQDKGALVLADETLLFMDQHLRSPLGGGFVEALPAQGPMRRQNPHMHLFEAMISLYMVSSESRYLARAAEIFGLFTARFYQGKLGVLAEYFDEHMEPQTTPRGVVVEPGHHYEWFWLLHKFRAVSDLDVAPFADALRLHAETYGLTSDGLVFDELYADGTPKSKSYRIWPITEAIRSKAMAAQMGLVTNGASVETTIAAFFECFLTGVPDGGWIDRLDERRRPAIDFMPASTLYHIAGAVAELEALQ